MAKSTKASKAIKETIEETVEETSVKKTVCYLASKANHIVEIQNNGQTTYIQPFGRVKVIKEQVKINPTDAKNLTFIKA